jgi:hypothetical protein
MLPVEVKVPADWAVAIEGQLAMPKMRGRNAKMAPSPDVHLLLMDFISFASYVFDMDQGCEWVRLNRVCRRECAVVPTPNGFQMASCYLSGISGIELKMFFLAWYKRRESPA